MANQWYFIIICSLLSIIPAGIVVVVMIFKNVEVRGELSGLQNRLNAVERDSATSTMEYNALLIRISEAEASSHKANLKIGSVEESLVSLSNKWNSRERAEKCATRKKEKEEEKDESELAEKPEYDPFADHNQMVLPFPPQPLQQQQTQQPIKRKFGQMPGR